MKIKELRPTPPPREFVVTFSEREFAYITYLIGRSHSLDATEFFGLSSKNLWNDATNSLGYTSTEAIIRDGLLFSK
jgi:hypothetical protein